MKEDIYLVALHSLWFTHKKFFFIFEKEGNYKSCFEKISYSQLRNYGFSDLQIEKILSKKEKINLEKIEKTLKNRQVNIIKHSASNFPSLLKQIPNTPYFLYTRWDISSGDCISVIWSRKVSSYWRAVIEKIIPDLLSNFTIVSGWAYGCDSIAHETTINNSWKTISVIWTWIDIDYPASNSRLYNDILKSNWAIISIFPLWEPWNTYNFPIRNEIVAWLSLWTIVVEAAEKSWSLITAKLSLDLWKDLFAIPWDIFKDTSRWCNNLIAKGEAKITTKADDILEEYWKTLWEHNKKIIFNDELEKIIYKKIQEQEFSVDELTKTLDMEITTLNLKLSMMELSWLLKKINWSNYTTIN